MGNGQNAAATTGNIQDVSKRRGRPAGEEKPKSKKTMLSVDEATAAKLKELQLGMEGEFGFVPTMNQVFQNIMRKLDAYQKAETAKQDGANPTE